MALEHGTLDPEALRPVLEGRYADLRRELLDVLARPEFAPPIALSTPEYRRQVLGWARSLAAEGLESPNRRFFTMLGALVQGRVCISGASLSAAKTCDEVRACAGELVDAFGIPDAVLAAPIATGGPVYGESG